MDWIQILDLAAKWIIIPVGAYFVQKWIKTSNNEKERTSKRNRAKDIKFIADEGFLFIEALQKTGQIGKGTEKWTKFIQYVTTNMLSEGLGSPSGEEMKMLEEYARGRAALEKMPTNGPRR